MTVYINGVANIGDMKKSDYDPDADGLIAVAEVEATLNKILVGQGLGSSAVEEDKPTGGGDAYLTVAAADTPATLKGRADYTGDGAHDMGDVAGDEAEINTALGAADTVILCPGTYWVNNPISLASGKSLIGSGPGTVIKIRDSKNANLDIIVNSDTTDGNERILITRLKLDGNKGNNASGTQYGIHLVKVGPRTWDGGGYYVYNAFGVTILNCLAEDFRSGAIYLNYCNNGLVQGNEVKNCAATGLWFEYCYYMRIEYNLSLLNAAQGIRLDPCSRSSIVGNICQANNRHGISFSVGEDNVVANNICVENSQQADSSYDNMNFNESDYNLITDNICRIGDRTNKPRYGINISVDSEKNIIRDNDLHNAGKTANLNDAGTLTHVEGNRELEITDEKVYAYIKNTSGGALAAGDVVILKSVAAGNEVTTTVTEGDQNVFGMVAEAIADTASGYVLVKGKTTALKVDGTTDIAIGDLIGCFTTVKIGMKAATGKMAFAIALEAYATNDSSGVIDALLISPRQAI